MNSHKITNSVNAAQPTVVNLRCPHCRHVGAFHGLPNCNDLSWSEPAPGVHNQFKHFAAGVRRCPNNGCHSLVQVVLQAGRLVESFPPEVIDFDSTNLPPEILSSLEEAIKAHAAGCFRACALMVRRVLEELCDDKKATGSDLKQRLAALGTSVVVPKELLDAADELRLLGNDAAHISAKNYDSIGPEQATLAIELAKELLKAVYQYASLVDRLKALKKP
jgi:hypothetical protein